MQCQAEKSSTRIVASGGYTHDRIVGRGLGRRVDDLGWPLMMEPVTSEPVNLRIGVLD